MALGSNVQDDDCKSSMKILNGLNETEKNGTEMVSGTG